MPPVVRTPRPPARTVSRPTSREVVAPRPIQFTPFTKEHLSTDSGIAFFNQWAAQVVNGLNRGTGQSGPIVLPAGINVAGGKISGLGKPESETDAVSLAHADANYSPAVASPALDIGGTHPLKGLTSLFLQVGQVKAGLPTTYKGGDGTSGAVNLFGLILQMGFITSMDTATFPMAFPSPFIHACQGVLCATTGPNDRITYVPSFSIDKFTLANNGSGAGACWMAFGF